MERILREVRFVKLVLSHERTPRAAKWLAGGLVAYALSPIDLIPDFIPVLGYVDDLILLPLGVWLVLKLVPGDVMAECRAEADRRIAEWRAAPKSRVAAAVIVALWLAALALALWLAWPWLAPRPAG